VATADSRTKGPRASERGPYRSLMSIRARRECRKLLNPQSAITKKQ
jgi:hypothetical protein